MWLWRKPGAGQPTGPPRSPLPPTRDEGPAPVISSAVQPRAQSRLGAHRIIVGLYGVFIIRVKESTPSFVKRFSSGCFGEVFPRCIKVFWQER